MDPAVHQYLRKIAAKGGRAGKGRAKARTPAQARKAINARWKKHRQTKAKPKV